MIFLTILFYLSALLMAAVCIFTANNMSSGTCRCMKSFLIMIVIGLTCLVCSIFYSQPPWYRLVSMLPIMWGITGWLLFDRYRAHEDLDRFRDYLLEIIFYIKNWILGR